MFYIYLVFEVRIYRCMYRCIIYCGKWGNSLLIGVVVKGVSGYRVRAINLALVYDRNPTWRRHIIAHIMPIPTEMGVYICPLFNEKYPRRPGYFYFSIFTGVRIRAYLRETCALRVPNYLGIQIIPGKNKWITGHNYFLLVF